ncbi:MAG: helix-turn-helix domain-containing protein [Clostridia bacterium]|nr:helix-turn-helix domain-containing protein [Clostridia bacterium]
MNEKNKTSDSIFKLDIGDVRVSVVRSDGSFKTSHVDSASRNDSTHWLKTIHSHAGYEVFFILNGNLDVYTEEGTDSYSRKVVIIPPGFNHYTLSNDNKCYVLLFSISPIQNRSDEQFRKISKSTLGNILVMPISSNVEFYVRRLSEAFGSGESYDKEYIEPLLTLAFHEIFKSVYTGESVSAEQNETRSKKASHSRYVSLIEAYVQKNYAERINLSTLAGELYLSTKQVSRIIKKEYDCTFSELINRKRMSAACMLLKNTDMKISDIIKQLNYTSENYFYVLFKKYYGVSPRNYR